MPSVVYLFDKMVPNHRREEHCMTILDEKSVAYFKSLEAGIAKANQGIDKGNYLGWLSIKTVVLLLEDVLKFV